ncbi:Na/Pi cotransporter family protein [Methylibium sp. Root1272]|uniref:Na/Pi cotransporter family protein n=1 Tax=Methylibium sp. Root1272 TaxID=1736441 RepID=UPI000700E994|nr:Na/Pi symporter [Methylibium sp. Root1272]KQW70075.1 hypothetical protein ASC67_06255 [Methylibium sp. Root1272]
MRTLLEMLAGVALVVWGTDLVKIAAIRLLGIRLQQALQRISRSKAKCTVAGGLTAIVLQSSNAASLIFCSFLARAAISVDAALFALLGANIGTAIVARILTFDVGAAASLLVIIGAALHLKEKGFEAGHAGRVLLGLGLVIVGLRSISSNAEHIFRSPNFIEILRFLPHDVPFFALMGVVLTLLCYSSLATVVVAAELVSHGSVDLLLGFAIVVGANVGTGVSAALAARASGVRAKWVSSANLGFRLTTAAGVMLMLSRLDQRILPTGDLADVLMYGHIAFNFLVLILALPLAHVVGRWIDARAAVKVDEEVVSPKYLSTKAVSDNQAISDATREVLRISNRLQTMLESSQAVVRNSDRRLADETVKLDAEIDVIYAAVRKYLNQMSLDRLNPVQRSRWHAIMLSTINFEHAGDILERILRRLSVRIREEGLFFSEAQITTLVDLYDRLSTLLRIQTSRLVSFESEIGEEVYQLHEQMNNSVVTSIDEYIRFAASGDDATVNGADAVYLDLVSDLQHIARLFRGRSSELSGVWAASYVSA